MGSFAKLARKVGKNWEKAKEHSAQMGGSNVPNGRYIAQVTKYEHTESSSGRDQVMQEYKIIEGEFKGEKVTTYQGLDTEIGIGFFLKSLKALGYEPDGIEDCDDVVSEINKEKPKVRITVKGKDDGFPPNVFVDKALSAAEAADGEEEPEDESAGEGDDEAVELEVGMKVVAEVNGKEIEGEIVKIIEDKGIVKVEDEDGETHKVSIDDISVPEDEEEDEADDDEDDEEDEDEDEDDADKKPAKKVTKKTGSLKKKKK